MNKYWEIVRLTDGSFALQSSEENDAPLVRIEFSEFAEDMLKDQLVEVAQAMIGAGVQAASFVEEATIESFEPVESQILH
jgi:hypothetical protein